MACFEHGQPGRLVNRIVKSSVLKCLEHIEEFFVATKFYFLMSTNFTQLRSFDVSLLRVSRHHNKGLCIKKSLLQDLGCRLHNGWTYWPENQFFFMCRKRPLLADNVTTDHGNLTNYNIRNKKKQLYPIVSFALF